MSGRFLTELAVVRHGEGWELVYPLEYESGYLKRTLVVPTGFKTDFASVPRLPLAFWLFAGLGEPAAVVHDFLYGAGICSRKDADEVFAEALKACGVAGWRRGPMWLAVRMAGGSRYTPTPA